MTEILDRQTEQRDDREQVETRYSERYDPEIGQVIVEGIKQADETIIVSPGGGFTSYTQGWVPINEPRTIMTRHGQEMYGLEVTRRFTIEGVTGLEFDIDESGNTSWRITVQDERAAKEVSDHVKKRFSDVYEQRSISEHQLGPAILR